MSFEKSEKSIWTFHGRNKKTTQTFNNEEFCDLNSSWNLIRAIKSRRLRWVVMWHKRKGFILIRSASSHLLNFFRACFKTWIVCVCVCVCVCVILVPEIQGNSVCLRSWILELSLCIAKVNNKQRTVFKWRKGLKGSCRNLSVSMHNIAVGKYKVAILHKKRIMTW